MSSCASVVFSVAFLYLFQHWAYLRYFIESLLKISDLPGTDILMLPLAYSLGTIINVALLWFFIKKDFLKKEPFIFKTFFQSLGASFFIGLTAYIFLNLLAPLFGTTTFWGIFLQGFISGIAGIAAGIFVLYLLKNEELKDLAKTLHTKFWRAKVVAPPQESL